MLSFRQKQIIYGSLLGNGCIVSTTGNPYLSITDNNNKWLYHKASELSNIARLNAISEDRNRLKWRSKSATELVQIKELCFSLNENWLEKLADIAMAVWFIDKGYFINKNQICLRTSKFKNKGNLIIKKYLDSLDIWCQIKIFNPNTPRIVLTKDGTINFLKTIKPCFPQFMPMLPSQLALSVGVLH